MCACVYKHVKVMRLKRALQYAGRGEGAGGNVCKACNKPLVNPVS